MDAAHYEQKIAELNGVISDLRARLAAAEREVAQLRGLPPPPDMMPAMPEIKQIQLAPYDSPVHEALVRAAMQGDENKVMDLINQGANPNHADQLGSTPLHWAAQGGHDRIIPLLLAAGANPKTKNVKKQTPEQVAAGKAKTNKDCWKPPKKR